VGKFLVLFVIISFWTMLEFIPSLESFFFKWKGSPLKNTGFYMKIFLFRMYVDRILGDERWIERIMKICSTPKNY
jgi:hypothetical protein